MIEDPLVWLVGVFILACLAHVWMEWYFNWWRKR